VNGHADSVPIHPQSGERDRRLDPAEERAIRSVLAEKEGRYEELVLFEMALESAMRLREIYTLSDVQISSIAGHKDLRMLRRYANLRGRDLATRLW